MKRAATGDRRPHVTHLVDTDAFGGAEQTVAYVVPGLSRAGWRVSVLHRDDPGVRPLLDQLAASCPDVEVVAYRRAKGLRGGLSLCPLVREMRKLRPDVVHAHLPTPLAARTGIVAARLAGVASVVATLHLVTSVPGGLVTRLKRRSGRLVDRFVAVSEAVAAGAGPVVPRGAHVTVVPNAVAVPAVPPAADPGNRVVLCLARLEEQKGLGHLVAAATDVPQATFLVAGEGPLRDSLRAAIRRAGLQGRFHLLGHRTDRDHLLAAADVVVLPSLNEGLPLSVLEAMAAGRAVVATSVGGTPEAVVHGVTGLLVPPADATALAGALRHVLDDRALRARFARAGRRRAEARFSVDAVVTALAAVYDELLDGRARA